MPSPANRLALLLVLMPGVVAPAPPPRPSFEPERIERAEPACRPSPARHCARVLLSGLRVRFPAGPVGLAIQAQLDRALAGEEAEHESPRALADSFIADSRRARGPSTGETWFLERRLRLLSRRPRLLSFAVESARFTGGAHPAQDLRFLNLDPQTGSPTTLADLLVPGGAARLTAIARHEIRRRLVVRAALRGDADAGSAADREIGLPDSVGVTADALVLAYDAYEIAPYSAGPFKIEIKLTQIRGLLRADGPLGGERRPQPAG